MNDNFLVGLPPLSYFGHRVIVPHVACPADEFLASMFQNVPLGWPLADFFPGSDMLGVIAKGIDIDPVERPGGA